MVQELPYIEKVPFVIISRVLIIRVLREIIFVRVEGPHAAELQDAFAPVHDGKFIHGHQVLPQLLVVQRMRLLTSPALTCVERVDRLLAERRVQPFQCRLLSTAEEDPRVHIPYDGFRVVLVDRLELRLCLEHQAGRDLTAPDGRHQLFKVRDLADVGRLVDEAPDMDREPPAVYIVRLLAEQVEELAVDHGNKEIECRVGVRHDQEQGCLPVPERIQFEFVISGDLPELRDIEGCKPRSARNKYRFSCFACC